MNSLNLKTFERTFLCIWTAYTVLVVCWFVVALPAIGAVAWEGNGMPHRLYFVISVLVIELRQVIISFRILLSVKWGIYGDDLGKVFGLRCSPKQSQERALQVEWLLPILKWFVLAIAFSVYDYQDFGLKIHVPWFVCYLIGFAAFVPFHWLGRRSLFQISERDQEKFDAVVKFQSSSLSGASGLSFHAFFLTAAEELVYRGVFVFFLAGSIGMVPAIVFGLVMFLLIHLYQGLSRVPRGILFYCIVIGLSLTPLGLVAAMGLHGANNFLCYIQFARSTKNNGIEKSG